MGHWHHDVCDDYNDHDIWVANMRRYTLAVGRAPFHAAKREDIYKKLKDGEYKWPDLSKFQNEISAELREVVSSLLVPENDRPNPDKIVSHDFFKMNYIPLELSSKCTTVVPRWPTVRPPSPATVRRGYTEEWHKLCKESGVGEYEPGKTFTVFGGRKVRSVAKDCQKEIDLQKQPAMPFDKGVVYLPFPERAPWPARTAVGLSEIAEEKESSSEGPALVETTGNDRARENPPRLVRAEEDLPKENIEPEEPEPVRRLAEKPTRMRTLRKISNPDRVTAGTAPVRTIRYPRAVQRTRSTREATKANEELQVEVKGFTRSQAVGSNEPRRQPQPQAQPTPIIDLTTPESENLMIPFTDPTMVLMRISKFRDNVARALTSRSRPPIRPSSPHLPFVSKWVDYSRKHGVGYVLEEGSIGCLLNATSKHPVTHVVARDGHTCLGNVARDITRVEQAPLEYYTDFGGKGLRVAPISKDRRKMINTIWSKFGKYMCQQLGTADGRPTMPSSSMQTSFVKFYQRLGNVGVWGFGDGSFQVYIHLLLYFFA
jgi:myosin-1